MSDTQTFDDYIQDTLPGLEELILTEEYEEVSK